MPGYRSDPRVCDRGRPRGEKRAVSTRSAADNRVCPNEMIRISGGLAAEFHTFLPWVPPNILLRRPGTGALYLEDRVDRVSKGQQCPWICRRFARALSLSSSDNRRPFATST